MICRLIIYFSLLILLSIAGVPAGALAQERFIDNGDGTITDTQLKLMWAQTDNHGDIDWHQAQKWVRYTFPDTLPKHYGNWRLPTLEELETLVVKESSHETDCGLKAFIIPLIRLSCSWIWTADTDIVAPTAKVYNFDKVYHYTVRKAHRRGYRVLAVRNIP